MMSSTVEAHLASVPSGQQHNLGSVYDLERLEDYRPELLAQLTNDDDTITRFLRHLIRQKKLLLVDKESMIPWEADAVVKLTNGKYVITHPR
jgi:hypothetical protein